MTTSRAALFALLSAGVMMATQVAAKATRDALFLSHFDVVHLPKVVIAAAIISFGGVLVVAQIIARFGPTRAVPVAFVMSACMFLIEWALVSSAPELVAIALYLHLAAFGAILISGFWSILNERFDPHTARTTIARVTAATTLGGIAGAVLAERVSSWTGVTAMLPILALMHAVCAPGILAIGRPSQSAAAPERPAFGSGLRILASNTYLRQMVLLLALLAFSEAFLDYALKAEASAIFHDADELVGFFATFYAVVGLVTFLVQSAFGARILDRYGIGVSIAILPAVVSLGSLVTAGAARLTTVALVRASHTALGNSLFRSGFELLYTPLSSSVKRPTKAIVDVASERIGDMLGAGVLLLMLFAIPEVPAAAILLLASLSAAGALYLVFQLHFGYVAQLAKSLADRTVSLDPESVVDATTREILAEVTGTSERETLQAWADAADGSAEAYPETTREARFGLVLEDLRASDAERIKRALRSEAMDVRLVPHLVPLLAREDVAEDVRLRLRWLVPQIIGQLTDAMLDPDLPLVARQRIPGVLDASHNPRSVHGLMQGLADPEFNVRYSCARAISRMQSRNEHLEVQTDAIFVAISREVSIDRDTWDSRRLAVGPDVSDTSDPAYLAAAPHACLQHVFTLLELVLDRDAVQVALHAVIGSDAHARGTALEYLENVLPDNVRGHLWRQLDIQERQRRSSRPRREIVRDLLDSAERLATGPRRSS